MEFFFSLRQYGDVAVLLLRIAIGAIFLVHGSSKWAMWKVQPSEQMPRGMINMMRFLSIVEPLGALAVFVGFFTQLTAAGLAIIMIGAIKMKKMAWKTHFVEQQKTGWEFDFLILFVCIALFIMGAGYISIDSVMGF